MSYADSVRQVAKWLIAAFAAVGAVLAAGVQISNLGDATGVRLLGAVVASAIGLAGIVLAIVQISRVLEPQEATLRDLEQSDVLAKRLREDSSFFDGFDHADAASLISDYKRASSEFRSAQAASWGDPKNQVLEALATARESEYGALASVVEFWRDVVTYEKAKAVYRSVLLSVVVGVALAFAGLVGFAYCANPPKKTEAPSTPTAATWVGHSSSDWTWHTWLRWSGHHLSSWSGSHLLGWSAHSLLDWHESPWLRLHATTMTGR